VAVLTVVIGLLVFSGAGRLALAGANTINTALACLLLPIVGISFVLREGTRPLRIITVALIPAALLVALATGSRGPLLALLALGILWAIRRFTRPRLVQLAACRGRCRGRGCVAPGRPICHHYPAHPVDGPVRIVRDFVQGVLSGRLDSSTADISTGDRIVLFQFALTLFQDNRSSGSGLAVSRRSVHGLSVR